MKNPVGSVYQRKSDGRWVAQISRGPRGARSVTTRYANSEAEAITALHAIGGSVTPQSASDRFWSKVKKGRGCWEWQAYRIRPGSYGVIHVDGRRVIASRFAYEDVIGPIPVGMFVLHRCDNPPCVRPDHLVLGTAAENSADMISKGRAAFQRMGSTGAELQPELHDRSIKSQS